MGNGRKFRLGCLCIGCMGRARRTSWKGGGVFFGRGLWATSCLTAADADVSFVGAFYLLSFVDLRGAPDGRC